MINNKRVLAIITARCGSKDLPNKNVMILGDKPLLAWPIEAARNSDYVDKVIVSTDLKIIKNVVEIVVNKVFIYKQYIENTVLKNLIFTSP